MNARAGQVWYKKAEYRINLSVWASEKGWSQIIIQKISTVHACRDKQHRSVDSCLLYQIFSPIICSLPWRSKRDRQFVILNVKISSHVRRLIETATQAKAGIPNILMFSWHVFQLCNYSRNDHEHKERKFDGRTDLNGSIKCFAGK